MTRTIDKLKLIALDREGLGVISAHAQDTCLRRADMRYLPGQKRFLVSGMRYDWAGAEEGRAERVGSVLRFDRVLKVSHLGLDEGDDSRVLNLLAVTFEKTDPPSGRHWPAPFGRGMSGPRADQSRFVLAPDPEFPWR